MPKRGRRPLRRTGALLCFILLCLSGIAEAQSRSRQAAGEERRARSLIDQGRPEEAVPIYEALRVEFPDSSRVLVGLTVAHFQSGRFRDAIRVCRELLRTSPDSVPAHLFLGASHLQLGEAGQAVEPLARVIEMAPDERNARIMLAEALLLAGRPAEAQPQFEVASELLPDDPRPWYGLNRVYSLLSQTAEDQLAVRFPDSGYSHAVLGERHEAAGSYGSAVRRFVEALSDRALDPVARQVTLSALVKIYERSGHTDWGQAAEEMFQADRAPACAVGADVYACLYRDGRLEEILDSDPSASPPSHAFWKARALGQLAMRARERLAGLGDSPQLHEIEARLQGERGNHRQAAGLWERALALAPSNRVLKLGLANALFESNDFAQATPLLDGLVAEDPNAADYRYLRGACLLNLQQADRAVLDLSQAVQLRPGLDAARAELARAYLMTGSPERAIPHLRELLDSDSDGTHHYRIAQAYEQTGQKDLAGEALSTSRELMLAGRARQQALLRESSEVPPPGQAGREAGQ